MKNQTPRDRASSSKGKERHQFQNPNFQQNSSENSQWEEAHVDSATPTPNGGKCLRASGGRRRGRRNGAHQPSSKPAALAKTETSGRESHPTVNSFSVSTGSTTSITHMPGSPNGYTWSHQGSALISWSIGPAICTLKYVLATFVCMIIFFLF
ncbi:uncharacterized protein LOC131218741 [Magnolia sinica]|uniref:uncharacterized protein LOC131218741 n=1 Tax=Magnolia sinica TaxID=86752 RepID=UPI0026597F99|nr:uncharacterized protein LOC131218741 [Magnolia sinica]